MGKYDKYTQVVLPLNTVKTNLTSALSKIGSIPTMAGPGNEGIELIEFIQEKINDGSIDLGGFVPSVSTNLSFTNNATTVTVESDTGTDAIIPSVTTTLAGVMSATDKINLESLITLSGVSPGSLHLGTFFGSIIPDNSNIKDAIQALETQLELLPSFSTGDLLSTTTAISITNGLSSVINGNVELTLNPANILLQTLGGNLTLRQIDVSTANIGDVIQYDGLNFISAPYVPAIPDHNDLGNIQGGTVNEYYHLSQSLFDQLINATSATLLGSSAGGVVEEITVSGSIEFSGTSIQLDNDLATPGNNKYYGTDSSGVKGWYSISTSSGVTSVSVTDTGDLDLTVVNPTTTPNISAVLTATGVSAGTYGTNSDVSTITVDTKGRITSATNTPINITVSQISDYVETTQDTIATTLVAGTNISLVYNDTLGTITINNNLSLSGAVNRVAWFNSPTSITFDNDLTFDGTYLTVGASTPSSLARLTTKGLGNTVSTYGIVHQNTSGTEVFKVDDTGAVTIGALGDVFIHQDQMNISAGGTYVISKSGGDLGLYSDTTVVVESGGIATNTASFKSVATRSTNTGSLINAQIEGNFSMVAGSNRYSDLYINTQVNQSGGTSPIRSIYINPTLTAATNYAGIEINAPGHHALKTTAGHVSFTLGSDATGDIYYRDSNGNLARLPIGTASQVLGSTGTVPAWTTTSGSLPGGSAGDFLIYSGGNWTAASQLKEKQSGITGTNMTLASPPLASTPIYIYKNGVLQDDPDDYSISGTTVTFVNALVSADKIISIYFI